MRRYRQSGRTAWLPALAAEVAAVLGLDRRDRLALAGAGPTPPGTALAEALPLGSPAVAAARAPASVYEPELLVEPTPEHFDVWELVRRSQAGDGEAFGQLYDRYVDTVFRYVFYRVGDRALAEDFTSETFLRALRRIGAISYQGRDIGAWFVTIARNIVFDHTKSARNRLEVPTADVLDGDEHAPSPETAALDSFTTRALTTAIGQLSVEQRECVLLRFAHGLSVSETAAAMGKTDGAIKALQHRAVKKLADIIGGSLR